MSLWFGLRLPENNPRRRTPQRAPDTVKDAPDDGVLAVPVELDARTTSNSECVCITDVERHISNSERKRKAHSEDERETLRHLQANLQRRRDEQLKTLTDRGKKRPPPPMQHSYASMHLPPGVRMSLQGFPAPFTSMYSQGLGSTAHMHPVPSSSGGASSEEDLNTLVSGADQALLSTAAAAGDELEAHRRAIEGLVDDPNSFWGFEAMRIVHNPHSLPGQPQYERFVAAAATAAKATAPAPLAQSQSRPGEPPEPSGAPAEPSGAAAPPPIKLVFHGTAEANVESILRDGMDPSRRGEHGQAYGPGEYFAVSAFLSLGYCRGGAQLLVFAVIDEKAVRGGGRGGIVVVDQVERQLPLATIHIQQPDEAVLRAANLARQAAAAAARAQAAAKRAMKKAQVMKLLMNGDHDAAAELYGALVAEHDARCRSGVPAAAAADGGPSDGMPTRLPRWAHELRFYLRDLPRDLVEALFPGVIPVEFDGATGGWRHTAAFPWPPTIESLGRTEPPASSFYASAPDDSHIDQFDAEVLRKQAADEQKEADKAEAHARSVRAAELARRQSSRRHPAATASATPRASAPPATVAAVMKELRRLKKLPDVALGSLLPAGQGESGPPFEVTLPDESNLLVWRVAMALPADTSIGEELRSHPGLLRPVVDLELVFGFDFPASPPFVRVVSPRFAFHTGHVTVGGSICMELLTTSGWDPSFTIEATLIMVRDTMLSGGARLDPLRATFSYGESEARAAFLRVARQHGWQ